MDLKLKDKVAVVTGASEGIGKAIALSLASEGVKLAICARKKMQLQDTAHEIAQKTGSDILAVEADMTNEEDIKTFVQQAVKKYGTIHILVNNVGFAKNASLQDLSRKDWQEVIDGNLSSAISCTKEVISYMKDQDWGRIINISAVSGKQPSPNLMASNVAKSGLLAFSKTLSNEVARDNITVNAVCPGRILTPQIERLFPKQKQDEVAKLQIPMNRFGKPEELADLVTFLSSEQASYITGTAIAVDGGMTKNLF